MGKIIKNIVKITVAVTSALLVVALTLPIAVTLVASVPAVQTAVAKRVTSVLSERLGTRVAVDRVHFKLVNRVEVEGFLVEDFRGDTLLYAPRLVAPVIEWGLWGEPLTFGRVRLEGAEMWIRRDEAGVVNIRELVRAIRGGRAKNPDPKFRMHIVGIEADSITFGLLREDRPPRAAGVDFGRFVITDTRVRIEDFSIDGPRVKMQIRELAFDERSGFDVQSFEAQELLVARGEVSLRGVEVRSLGSRVRLPHVRIVSEDANWRDFRDFADSILLDIAVDRSHLTTDFLGLFVPAVAPWRMTFDDVSARVEGPLAALGGRVESVRTGSSILSLDFTSRGLPDLRNANIEGVISRFDVVGNDLSAAYPFFENIGTAQFTGTFSVSPAAEQSISTLGLDGRLSFDGLAAGRVLGIENLGLASGRFDVNGSVGGGLVSGTASGSLLSLAFGGNTYNNIALAGQLGGESDGVPLDAGSFTAELSARDPWRHLGLSGELRARVTGNLGESGSFSSTGMVLGTAELLDAVYVSEHNSVTTPRVGVTGLLRDGERTLSLRSEFVDGDLRSTSGEGFDVELVTKDTDRLLGALAPGVQVASGTRVNLTWGGKNDTTSETTGFLAAAGDFSLTASSEFVEAGGVLLGDLRLFADRRSELLELSVQSSDLYSGTLHVPDFRLLGRAEPRRMALSLDGERWLAATGVPGRELDDVLRISLDGFDLEPFGKLLSQDALLRGRATGYVDIASVLQEPQIGAEITLEGLDMSLLDPLMPGVLERTTGTANARLELRGSLKDMSLDGEVNLANLETTLKPTGTTYSLIDGHIKIAGSRAELGPTTIHDTRGGTARLTAALDLTDLRNPAANLEGVLDNFLVLDTDSASGESFFGRVATTGTLSLRSERMGTQAEARLRTESETDIHLPLSARSNISWGDFVVFADPGGPPPDTTNVLERKREAYERRMNSARTGPERRRPLDANLTIDVTPEAQVHLVIDPRLGRGITARGEGEIGLGINPATNLFTMTGDYSITEGRFEFSMMDVLTRSFVIAPGSTLRWGGVAEDAMLDVRALYRVRTSLSPLVGEGSPLASGRTTLPVDCVLEVQGALSAPDITFDIEFPSVDTDARLIAAAAMNTEELKSMQFLSLLATGSFASGSSFMNLDSSYSGALANGAVGFDILTSQLSNLLSSEDYDVYFRYRPQDNFTNNRFDVGFSTGFVDDRLLLQIEGNYIDDRSAASVGTGNVSNLAGDVSLTWVIDRAGNLRLKAFTQTIDRLNETQGLQESGLGVSYKKDFDRVRDAFRRKKRP